MHRDNSSAHPGVFDARMLDSLVRPAAPIVHRLWPADLNGIDRLPSHNRFLIVANHSGMGAAELWSLLAAWSDRFGTTRPIAGMAHPAAFRVPVLRDALQALGAVEATRAGAARARACGVPLLLFPGGDHEATRPIWDAYVVDFAGRKGWIRLAREHGLGIVPLCITGSHVTLPILAHGRAVSWLIGTRAIGVHRAPLPALSPVAAAAAIAIARACGASWFGAALAGWGSVWLTLMLPWIPSRIGFHFLPEIPASELDAMEDQAVYDRVVGALQDTMAAARTRPRDVSGSARPTPAYAHARVAPPLV